MDDKFTSDQLKVLGCFISPMYPKAIRSVQGVVRETGLSRELVVETLTSFGSELFLQIETDQWSFNLPHFVKKYYSIYPELFREYVVLVTPFGLVMGPDTVSVKLTIEHLLTTDLPEGVGDTLGQLLASLNPEKATTDSGSDEVSFAM